MHIYVSRLDENIDEECLRRAFSPFGTIENVKIIMENGRSKGFGFVTFSSEAEGKRAITEMNGTFLGNKPIYVGLAYHKEERTAHLSSMYLQQVAIYAKSQLSQFSSGIPGTSQGLMFQPESHQMFQHKRREPSQTVPVSPICSWRRTKTEEFPPLGARRKSIPAVDAGASTSADAGAGVSTSGDAGASTANVGVSTTAEVGVNTSANAGASTSADASTLTEPSTSPRRFSYADVVCRLSPPPGTSRQTSELDLQIENVAQSSKSNPIVLPNIDDESGNNSSTSSLLDTPVIGPPPGFKAINPLQRPSLPILVVGPRPISYILANTSPENRQTLLEEHLYVAIQRTHPLLAGRISAMMLEMYDTLEIIKFLENDGLLIGKINEIIALLRSGQKI